MVRGYEWGMPRKSGNFCIEPQRIPKISTDRGNRINKGTDA